MVEVNNGRWGFAGGEDWTQGREIEAEDRGPGLSLWLSPGETGGGAYQVEVKSGVKPKKSPQCRLGAPRPSRTPTTMSSSCTAPL